MSSPTIHDYFAKDHERLDRAFTAYRIGRQADDGAAARHFREFKTGLERHIRWEEGILFPIWERHTGMTAYGPTAVMRREHRRIEALLTALARGPAALGSEMQAAEQALLDLLAQHNAKEELVLYPDLDGMADDAERADLFAQLGDASVRA
jgi:regulator of cell morphogenesis and NO signaling